MASLHILWAPVVVDYDERAILESLDRYERRRLSRFVCGLCEKPLDRPGCGVCITTWEDPDTGEVHDLTCNQRVRVERIEKCLEGYRPRPERRKRG